MKVLSIPEENSRKIEIKLFRAVSHENRVPSQIFYELLWVIFSKLGWLLLVRGDGKKCTKKEKYDRSAI